MAVTKITSEQASNIPTPTLLSQRDEAKRIIASAPKNSADYKAATSNLKVLNKEIGKDLGVESSVANQLTAVQALQVQEARNTFSTTANVGTVPAKVQKAIDESLAKNIKAEESKITTALVKSQESEIRALLDTKADKATISAAKAENKTEINTLKSTLAASGFQGNSDTVNSLIYTVQKSDGTEGDSFIRTGNAAYASTDAGKNATAILDAGYGLLDEFNLPQAYKVGKTTIGFTPYLTGLAALDRNAETGQFSKGANLSTPADTSGRSVSHALTTFNAINQDIQNPVAVSNKAKVVSPAYDEQGNVIGNIVQDTLLDYEKGDAIGFYLEKPDGSYEYLGGSKAFTPTGGGGFFKSTLGKVLVSIGAGVALGPLAGAIAGGTASVASTIAAGALLGAGSSLLTGGDPLLGALTGGIGGGFASYIGSYGGLGSYLARSGVDLSVDAIGLLNNVVPGVGGAAAPITDLSTSLLDDATIASAQGAINAGAAAGLLDDATAATINTGINNARGGVMNQINPNVQTNVPGTGFFSDGRPITPGGYGLTSPSPGVSEAIQDILRDVSFANADEVAEAAQIIANYSGDTVTLIGPGGVPFTRSPIPLDVLIPGAGDENIAPPVEVTDTRPIPAPTPFPTIPTPIPTVPAPTPFPTVPAPTPAPIEDRSQPVVPTPNPSLLDTAGNVVDIAQEYLPPLLIAGSLLNREPVPTGVGDNRLPAWVLDPAMSAVIQRIQAAQAAMPAPMPNLFNAQFRRGGLGAGQFIGYDLLNRTGDIPQQTLLGVSPLAMPPMNLLGVTSGQAPTSQTALV